MLKTRRPLFGFNACFASTAMPHLQAKRNCVLWSHFRRQVIAHSQIDPKRHSCAVYDSIGPIYSVYHLSICSSFKFNYRNNKARKLWNGFCVRFYPGHGRRKRSPQPARVLWMHSIDLWRTKTGSIRWGDFWNFCMLLSHWFCSGLTKFI